MNTIRVMSLVGALFSLMSPLLVADAQTGQQQSRKTITIDIHCHILTPECDPLVKGLFTPDKEPFFFYTNPESREITQRQLVEMLPKYTSPEERIKDMDQMGIDVQVISPAPPQYYYWTEGALGLKLARMQNDRIAAIVKTYPKRFLGMGTLPLQDADKTVQELERIVGQLGFRSVEISSNVNGVDLDDARFEKFFAKAEELGVLIFIHPMGFTDGKRLGAYYLTNLIGQPLDSTVAVSRLIFGGVLERHPRLKICVAHGGGYLPFYAGRMDYAYKMRPELRRLIPRPPSTYLRQLYFDTVLYADESLAYLVKQVGSDHILMGTDYPADIREADPIGYVRRARSLSIKDKKKIMGGNAAQLLNLHL